jgi:hypothetical protein
MLHGLLVPCIQVSLLICRIGKSISPPKVDMPNLVSGLNRTPIFEWYVVRCGSKNGCQRRVFKRDRTMC